jgi:hypothetical protein
MRSGIAAVVGGGATWPRSGRDEVVPAPFRYCGVARKLRMETEAVPDDLLVM